MLLLPIPRSARSPQALLCPTGPYSFGPCTIARPCDAFHYWSLHTGCNFLLAGGSVLTVMSTRPAASRWRCHD